MGQVVDVVGHDKRISSRGRFNLALNTSMTWVGDLPLRKELSIQSLVAYDRLPSKPVRCPPKSKPWHGFLALLIWSMQWKWIMQRESSTSNCFATKQHWNPHLMDIPAWIFSTRVVRLTVFDPSIVCWASNNLIRALWTSASSSGCPSYWAGGCRQTDWS